MDCSKRNEIASAKIAACSSFIYLTNFKYIELFNESLIIARS